MNKKISVSKRAVVICMDCSMCGSTVENVSSDSVSVLCSSCVVNNDIKVFGLPSQVIAMQEKHNKKKSAKPRGWAFMREFVDLNGDVYEKGKLIKELTDQKPTIESDEYITRMKIEKPKKLTKKEKHIMFSKLSVEKSKKMKECMKLENNRASSSKIKKCQSELRKIIKELKKYL